MAEEHKTEETPPLRRRKLTHEQAKIEQRNYARGLTVQERLAACAALTKRLYRMRGIEWDERKADFTPRRIPRRQS